MAGVEELPGGGDRLPDLRRLEGVLRDCFTPSEFEREVLGVLPDLQRHVREGCSPAASVSAAQWFHEVLQLLVRHGRLKDIFKPSVAARPARAELMDAFRTLAGEAPPADEPSRAQASFWEHRSVLLRATTVPTTITTLLDALARLQLDPLPNGDNGAAHLLHIGLEQVLRLSGQQEIIPALKAFLPEELAHFDVTVLPHVHRGPPPLSFAERIDLVQTACGTSWPELLVGLAKNFGAAAPFFRCGLNIAEAAATQEPQVLRSVRCALAARELLAAAETECRAVVERLYGSYRQTWGPDEVLLSRYKNTLAVRRWQAAEAPEQPEGVTTANQQRRAAFIAALEGHWKEAQRGYAEAARKSASEDHPFITWLTWEDALLSCRVDDWEAEAGEDYRDLSQEQLRFERDHTGEIQRLRDIQLSRASEEADLFYELLREKRPNALTLAAGWTGMIERHWLLPLQAVTSVRAAAYAQWARTGTLDLRDLLRYGDDQATVLLDLARRDGSAMMLEPTCPELLRHHPHLGAWVAAARVLQGKIQHAEPMDWVRLCRWAAELRDESARQGHRAMIRGGGFTPVGRLQLAAELTWYAVGMADWDEVKQHVETWLDDPRPDWRIELPRQNTWSSIQIAHHHGRMTTEAAQTLLGRLLEMALADPSRTPTTYRFLEAVLTLKAVGGTASEQVLGHIRRLAEASETSRTDKANAWKILGDEERRSNVVLEAARVVFDAAQPDSGRMMSSDDLHALADHSALLPPADACRLLRWLAAVAPARLKVDRSSCSHLVTPIHRLLAHPDSETAALASEAMLPVLRADPGRAWILGTREARDNLAVTSALSPCVDELLRDPTVWHDQPTGTRADVLLVLARGGHINFTPGWLDLLAHQLGERDARIGWTTLRTIHALRCSRPLEDEAVDRLAGLARRDPRPLIRSGCRIWLDPS